jgi:hypothetical protein
MHVHLHQGLEESDECCVGVAGRQFLVIVGLQCRRDATCRYRGRLRRLRRAVGIQYLRRVQVGGQRSTQGRRQHLQAFATINATKSTQEKVHRLLPSHADTHNSRFCRPDQLSNWHGICSPRPSGLMSREHLKMDRLEDFSVLNGSQCQTAAGSAHAPGGQALSACPPTDHGLHGRMTSGVTTAGSQAVHKNRQHACSF